MPCPIPLDVLRLKHKDKRPREYLHEHEVDALIRAADGPNKIRDQALILISYRHGLRAGEASNIKWSQIDFETRRMHVSRQKGGIDSVHPIRDQEIRLLKKLWEKRIPGSPFVFMTNRGTKFNTAAFQKMIAMLGKKANLSIQPIHPHMLRHSTGYKLANSGVDTRTIQDYLGHANINNTVIYTKLASSKFDNLFLD